MGEQQVIAYDNMPDDVQAEVTSAQEVVANGELLVSLARRWKNQVRVCASGILLRAWFGRNGVSDLLRVVVHSYGSGAGPPHWALLLRLLLLPLPLAEERHLCQAKQSQKRIILPVQYRVLLHWERSDR